MCDKETTALRVLSGRLSVLRAVEDLVQIIVVMTLVMMQEAGLGIDPPVLHNRLAVQISHVRLEVLTVIFIIGKDFRAAEGNGIIAEVTFLEQFDQFRPRLCVEIDIILQLFRLQIGTECKTLCFCHGNYTQQ